MFFLPILGSTLGSKFATPAFGISPPLTYEFYHFPSNVFPPHTGVYPRLKICDPAFGISPPGLMNSFIFLLNSNVFSPHTGVYSRLKICDPAFGISTPGPMNSFIFL